MRDAGLLGLRLTLGGYLAAHGAQKLFGALDGPGLDPVAANFDKGGIRPGKLMAPLAGASEFVGGLLTVTGLASPVGPVAIAGAMTVATAVHGDKGPLLAKGGYELSLTYLAGAATLAATGPGRFSLDSLFHLRLPKSLVRLTVLGAAALTAYNVAGVLRTRRQLASRSATDAPAAAPTAAEPAVAETSVAAPPAEAPTAEPTTMAVTASDNGGGSADS